MKTSKSLRMALLGTLLAAALAGCGGGGGGGSEQPTNATPVPTPGDTTTGGTTTGGTTTGGTTTGGTTTGGTTTPPPPSDVTVACSGCAALNSNTYAGSGVGVWEKTNSSGADLNVPVSIAGLTGQNVTLVITNEGTADVAFPAIRVQSQLGAPVLKQSVQAAAAGTDIKERIAEFNRSGWAEKVTGAREQAAIRGLRSQVIVPEPKAAAYTVGSTRQFLHDTGDIRSTTLRKQATTSDGVTVNVWVENTEFTTGKVTQAMVDQMASSMTRAGGVYDMLKSMGGPLWGAHQYPAELIAGSGQPLDIVLLNFDKNARPYGIVGYFWAAHNLLKAVMPESNESLSLYLDTETMYLDGAAGLQAIMTTAAHEGMHMSNFYRRGVQMGPDKQFDLWAEEMSAMMMEDAASSAIDPNFNPIGDVRLPGYLFSASYNCAMTNFVVGAGICDSYGTAGSFGGFLLRQLGVGFYKQMLRQPEIDSVAAVDAAIKAAKPGSSIGGELRRFTATAASLMTMVSPPTNYGFPARSEMGFTIPALNTAAFKNIRRLPTASPATLKALASFPVERRAVSGTFSETIRVPAGATLSVVVQ